MNATTETIPEAVDSPSVGLDPQAETPETPATTQDESVRFVSPNQMRALKKQMQHQANLQKKRQLRWSQPNSDAKIEDLVEMANDVRNVLYQLQVLQRTLINKGVITKEDLEAVLNRDKERLAKMDEIKQNTTMTNDEKVAVAKEYELPLDLLGLTETITEPKGDV